jgi:hypothetical protein
MKLSPEQIEIYKDIDEILWNDWDPINLNAFAGWPKDEYMSYVPTIFSLKIKGGSIETIAEKLFEIQTNRMEIDDGYEKCKRAAEKIFNLK